MERYKESGATKNYDEFIISESEKEEFEQYRNTGFTPAEIEQMKWVSIEDRLPEIGKYDKPESHVLCGIVGKLVFEGYLNQWGTWSRANGANTKDLPPITHWKPLSTPPDRGEL